MKCSECNGTGKYDTGFSLAEACRECKGSGQVADTANSSEKSDNYYMITNPPNSSWITAAWSFNAQPVQFKTREPARFTKSILVWDSTDKVWRVYANGAWNNGAYVSNDNWWLPMPDAPV